MFSSKALKRILLIAFLLSGFAGASYAQDLNKKITMKLSDVTLRQALTELHNSTGVLFSYNPSQIPLGDKVSISCRNKPLRNVLDDLFKPFGITYSIVEKQVVLKGGKKQQEPVPQEQTKYTISGHVADSTSGEVLIGTAIYINGTTTGVIANNYGFYSLSLPPGKYELVYSFMGYNKKIIPLDLKKNEQISVPLSMSQLQMEAVIISDKDNEDWRDNLRAGMISLEPKVLQQMPGFAGEADPIKSLQAVPGIQSQGDGSSYFFVRGGKNDQNLILVDEAPVYNASHLFGFFTSMVPDAVKNIDIYKGDAPAQYGGRLSSVIDMQLKDGNMERFGLNGSTNLFANTLALEAPFKKNVSSFYVALRTSNLGWISRSLNRNNLILGFSDFNSKLNIKINRNNRIFLTVYGGLDQYFVKSAANRTSGINWSNNLGTLRWNHIFNDKLFCNTTMYYSRYNYFVQIWKENSDYWDSHIYQGSIKSDFSWFYSPDLTFRMGIDLSGFESEPGNIRLNNETAQALLPVVPAYKSGSSTLYISAEQKLGKKWFVNYGLRQPVWRNNGETTVYYFDSTYNVTDTVSYGVNEKINSFRCLEPRLTITFSPLTGRQIKFSYNRNNQFLQILSSSISPFNGIESWVPSGPNIDPQRADQFAVGYFDRLLKVGFLFSAEAYYKLMRNQLDYASHPNLLLNPLLEAEVREGKINAYGVELMARKNSGALTGWISYTYSRSLVNTPELNEGRTYPALWDRPHNISIHVSWTNGHRWKLTANWIYLTGMPVTTPVGYYTYMNHLVPVYDKVHNDRLPDYHRLDISVTLALAKASRKWQHYLEFGIYNFYGRHNPIAITFNKIVDDNGNFVLPSDFSDPTLINPVTTAVAGFIPSLTYRFRL
ncbi:MAG: carboxypeptidase-like regulatory domain-containing protein [Bacteroidales bacterium]